MVGLAVAVVMVLVLVEEGPLRQAQMVALVLHITAVLAAMGLLLQSQEFP